MCDRNAKSECILIKICAFVSECIFERTSKLYEEIFDCSYLFFIYRWQNILVSNTALLTAVTCLEVTLCWRNQRKQLKDYTPAFIIPTLASQHSWPEPGRLPDLGEAAGACVSQPDSWRWPAEVTPDRRVGTFPPGVHRWSDQAVASTSLSLHLSTWRTFWTHTLVILDICTDEQCASHMSVRLSIVDIFVLVWPY